MKEGKNNEKNIYLKKVVSIFLLIALLLNIMPMAELVSTISALATNDNEPTYHLEILNNVDGDLKTNIDTALANVDKSYADVAKITITGSMVNTDFDTLKTTIAPYVKEIDISGVSQINYTDSDNVDFAITMNAFYYDRKTGSDSSLSDSSEYTNLTEINLPDSIKSIGDYAFAYCEYLILTSLPTSVRSIGDYAFAGCMELTFTSIPASVTTIGECAFDSCYSLPFIIDCQFYAITTIDDTAFGYSSAQILLVKDEVIAPDEMTELGGIFAVNHSGDFDGDRKSNIEEYNNGKSLYQTDIIVELEYIDRKAVPTARGLYNNENIDLDPYDYTITYTGESYDSETPPGRLGKYTATLTVDSYYSRYSLNNANKESVTSISIDFDVLQYIVTVNNTTDGGLKNEIDQQLIDDDKSYSDITDIIITGVMHDQDFDTLKTTIAPYVTVIDISGVTQINDTLSGDADFAIPMRAFYYDTKTSSTSFLPDGKKYDNLTHVEMPDLVKTIGECAFTYCRNLALTSLPDGVTEIGPAAFSNCTNLALISLPTGLTEIASDAFSRCKNLALISLPTGVTEIGEAAFFACDNLALTSLPDGLTTIGWQAFQHCTNLALTSLPDGLTTLESQVFMYCEKLALTSLPAGLKTIKTNALRYCPNLKLTSLPKGITSIGYSAFADNISLPVVLNCQFDTKPTIESGIPIFYQSSVKYLLVKDDSIFTDGEIVGGPIAVTHAGDFDGDGKSNLDEYNSGKLLYKSDIAVNLEYKDKKIVPTAKSIYNDDNIDLDSDDYIITYTDGNTTPPTQVGNYTATLTLTTSGDEKYSLYDTNKNPATSITLPFEVLPYTLTINNPSRELKQKLDDLLATNGDTYADVERLVITGVMYNEDFDTLKTTIAPYVKEIDISGVVQINDTHTGNDDFILPSHAFLYSVVTGNGSYLFDNSEYTKLTVVKIPNEIKKIDESAFDRCEKLASISLPTGVTSIANYAFSDCTNLKLTSLPTGVTSIGSYAFQNCTNLALTSLPTGITSIGSSAFYGCTSLPAVLDCEFNKTPTIGSDAFKNSSTKYLLVKDEGIFTDGQEVGGATAITRTGDLDGDGKSNINEINDGITLFNKSDMTVILEYKNDEAVPTAKGLFGVNPLIALDSSYYTITYTGDSYNSETAPTELGKYTATFTLTTSGNDNCTLYNSDKNPATSITLDFAIKAYQTGVTFTPYDAVYDGLPHGITVDPDGGTVTYKNPLTGDYDLTTSPTFTDAGSYTVYFKVTKPNHHDYDFYSAVSIQKATLTVDVTVKDKNYDGLNTAKINNANLVGLVPDDDVILKNGTPTFTTIDPDNDIPISFTDFSIIGDDIDNYTLTQPTGVTADINNGFTPEIDVHYTITDLNKDNWSNSSFRITPIYGYLISLTNTADGNWFDTDLTSTLETNDGTFKFYLKNKTTGEISVATTETYKIDKTLPTGKITIKKNAMSQLLNILTFNMFYKETVDITITADDNLSGVKTIKYQKVEKESDYDINGTWTEYNDKFSENPNQTFFIYAKITDNAGNVNVINSDGVVLFTDSEKDTQSITFNKKSTTDVTAKVILNQNTIKSIVNGDKTLINGTDYTVNGDEITFKSTYLDTLKQGDYTLTISYNPMGVEYAESTDNDEPLTTTISLTVNKNPQSEITVTGIKENQTYGDGPFTLDISGGDGDGNVTYTSSDSDIISINGNIATIHKIEKATITATKAGDDNYDSQTGTITIRVSPKTVTIDVSVNDKTYDGNDNATISGTAVIDGKIDADDLNVITGTAKFTDKNADTDKDVTFIGFTLSGADANNYELSAQPKAVKANIIPRPVTITGLSAENKIYDGTNTATNKGTAVIKDKIATDDLNVITGTAKFSDKNVGTDKVVTFTDYALKGADVDNYTLSAQPETVTADITVKHVAITGLSAENKIYDGNDTATISGTAVIDGKIDTDDLKVITGTANFSDKNADTDKDVTFTGFTLEGDDANNYTLSAQPKSVKANIDKKSVTITGLSAKDKIYDGNVKAEIAGTAVIDGKITNDKLDITTGTAKFADKNADNDKDVTFAGFTLEGDDADNYTLSAQPATVKANITPRPVTITGLSAKNKIYDGNDNAEIDTDKAKIDGKIDNDKLIISADIAKFSDKNVGTDKVVTFSGFTLEGDDANNYTLSAQPKSVKANITPRPVTITGISAKNKIYDGNVKAEIAGTAVIDGKITNDKLDITTGTAKFADKNADNDKDVTFTGFALNGDDANNYTLSAQPKAVKANITPRPVTITGLSAKDKIYDGNDTATILGTAVIDGMVANDKLDITTGTANFSDKNADTDKDVTFIGFTLDGADANNYTLSAQPKAVKANITPRPVTITGLSAKDKIYDGNDTATILGTAVIDGKIDTDDLKVITGTANFLDINVGTDIDVTFIDFTLDGTDANNYELSAQPETVTADITKSEQTDFVFDTETPEDMTYSPDFYYTNIANGGNEDGVITYTITGGTGIAEINNETGEITNITKAGTIIVTANKADSINFNEIFASYTLTVNKADPAYTLPENLVTFYGRNLDSITLPEGFAWVDGTQSVGDVGTNSFDVIFTPSETDVYNTINLSLDVKVIADTTVLQKEIDDAQKTIDSLESTDIGDGNNQYPKSVVDSLKQEIENAKSTIENTASTQADVDAAKDKLASALSTFKDSKIVVDFTALNKFIENAEALTKSDDYTDESWNALQETLENARAAMSKANVTQSEVDAAEMKLKTAINNLTTKSPQTGAHANPWISIGLVVLTGLGLIFGTKARKNPRKKYSK